MATQRIDPSSSSPAQPGDPGKLIELIRDVRVAMFTTFTENRGADGPGADIGGFGGMHTRPMYTHKLEGPESDSPNRFDGSL